MRLLILTILLITSWSTLAMEPRTDNTFQLREGEAPPEANLEDIAWLSGAWTGTAFGSEFEATWSPPSAGSMVGTFKLMKDGEVNFYEILTITRDDGRLNMKVKHFSADFIAWEEKDEFTNFKLVGLEETAVHFSGLSLRRVDADTMHGYIVMRLKDGSLREEKLIYNRRQL